MKVVDWDICGFYSFFGTAYPTRVKQYHVYSEAQRSGAQNPSWHKQIKSGQSATTPYQATFTSIAVQSLNVHCTATIPGGGPYVEGCAMVNRLSATPPTPDNDLAKSASSEAASRLSNSIRDTMTSFAGPTFIGEFRDTISMLRRPHKQLLDLIKSYYSLAYKARATMRGKDLTQYLSALYLQYQFGIRPLVSDIEGIIKAYNGLATSSSLRVRASSTKRGHSLSRGSDSIGGNLHYNWSQETTHTVGCRIVAGLRRSAVSAPSTDGISQVLHALKKFAFAEPQEYLLAGYELIPFSFVVDYFSNLNEILGSSYASLGNVAWASTTTKRESELVCNTTAFTNMPSGFRPILSGSPGLSVAKTIEYSRSADIPGVSFEWDLPSVKQFTNLGALLNSLRN